MVEKTQATQTGNQMFELFIEQVKQVLERLYDFAFLQQHTLARMYDGKSDLSAKTAGRQLRNELISAIESFKPKSEMNFRAPNARLYNMLHLIYVENLTIQEAAAELGLSERQAYRDLKRGQEMVAAALWDNRIPVTAPAQEFSWQSEMERLKLNFSKIDVLEIFQQAQVSVERLALQQGVEFVVETPTEPLILSTDSTLAHQIMVSLLSFAIQQAELGQLFAAFETGPATVTLTLHFRVREDTVPSPITDSMISKLSQRLHWSILYSDLPEQFCQVKLCMASSNATILVIDDNEGWVALLERFLEGIDCAVVPLKGPLENVRHIEELDFNAIILDVMMPEKDGWQILQILRTQPATAQIPIIVCTVFNDPQLAFSLGASAFLSKPTNREKFLEALRTTGVI